jgi:2-keto-3-deoxy-L-rhamnonate aldolase RhmA
MIFDARRALKTKLANRELVRGVLADFPSADLVASLARLGFDLIFIDCEHAGPDFETVVQMTRAARAGGAVTLLRPWSVEPGLVRRYIDCGVDGIVVPGMETALDARRLVGTIAAADPPDPESFVFVPLIESRLGVENLDAVLAVPGVDAVLVGASDLAVSLGEPRRGEAPRARAMAFSVVERARAAGRSAGLPASRFDAKAAQEGGANLLMWSTQELLKAGVRAQLEVLQGIANAG